MGKNRTFSRRDGRKERYRAVLKERFGSARGVEETGPTLAIQRTQNQVREICADDLRWDGRLFAPPSRRYLFQAHPIKLVSTNITPETQMRKHK